MADTPDFQVEPGEEPVADLAVSRADLRLPACLIILDGFGLAEAGEENAISRANTPCLDEAFSTFSSTTLDASGEAVGLPAGQMGNSEVGHLNIGAGRIVRQELSRINIACRKKTLASNEVLVSTFEAAKAAGAVLHLMGLLSDGGVHSSNEHLYALLDLACELGIPEVHVHCFMDGRDVPPQSGADYIEELEREIAKRSGNNNSSSNDSSSSNGGGGTHIAIASISGRYYAMDRDNRWDRVRRAFDAIVCATPSTDVSAAEVMEASYREGVTDEFVVPVALNGRGIHTGDAVVFFNFRPDRARELTRAFVDADFSGFERAQHPAVHFACMTEYDPTIDAPVVFPKEFPDNVIADVLVQAGLKQYHIAETEKYAHVTFFLNGGREEPKPNEERVLIPSPKVATYDLQPEMSAPEVARTLASAIEKDAADVYIVNFANCDMVGHTGSIPAAIAAVEAVDAGVAQALAAIRSKGGFALITADHGNADKMFDENGSPHTAHTTALVPLILVDYSGSAPALSGVQGALCDIAPTFLSLIGIRVPSEMTGANLLAYS